MSDLTGRKEGNRKPRNVVVIVTEGMTERIYFNGFKSWKSNVLIKTPDTSGTDAVNLVKFCILQISENQLNLKNGDLSVCVFDVDNNAEVNLEKAVDLAEKNGIILAVSNPCFELWLVLHFKEVIHQLSCLDTIELLRKQIKGYSKTRDYNKILFSKKETALDHAERLWARGGMGDRMTAHLPNPGTGVHFAVNGIEELIHSNRSI